jgi:hypothetical protein
VYQKYLFSYVMVKVSWYDPYFNELSEPDGMSDYISVEVISVSWIASM